MIFASVIGSEFDKTFKNRYKMILFNKPPPRTGCFIKRCFAGMLIASILIAFSADALSARPHSENKPVPLPPRISSTVGLTQGQPDTVRVLAIMVEFQRDDLETTTGDGSFGSAILEDSLFIYEVDPLPHDREYFRDQLLFLKNFYEEVSFGKVILDIENAVFPDTGAYQLPHPMWHYNHNDPSYLDEGLARLFIDAWEAADSMDTADLIPFQEYDPDSDCFIVFHAGVGKDFAFYFDPSPFDIPSAYMDSVDLVPYLPPDDPEGVSVDDGQFHVKRGMILPETENQMEYNLGMHGHMTILFGHHIGVPNLYDTETGESGIGLFGMMDQGSGKLDGMVPAPPCAWTKVHMGWVVPDTIKSFPDTKEAPVGKIFHLPINASEYFLIENIESYVYDGVSYDSLRYLHYLETGEYADAHTMLTEYIQDSVNVTWSRPGVLVDIEDWGIGRPASGILVWHIDQNVIDTKLAENRINTDPELRGVDLEEADGAQDIGLDYGLFSPGYGTELGSPFDAFYAGNEYFLKANPGSDSVEFNDHTFPHAKSNYGAYSHLILNGFSPIADTMTFTVTNDILRPGFPKTLPFNPEIFNADIDGVAGDELLAVSYDKIYGWNAEGGEILFYDLSAQILGTPTACDFDGDGRDEIAAMTANDLYILDYEPADSSVDAASILHTVGSPSIYTPFIIAADSVVFSNAEDSVFCWRVIGNIPQFKWGQQNPTSYINHACLMPDGGLVVSSLPDGAGHTEGWPGVFTRFNPNGDTLWSKNYFNFSGQIVSPAFPPQRKHAAGDIDRDGIIEIVALGWDGSKLFLFALNSIDGSLEDEFPLELSNSCSPRPNGPISLVDIDDDGYLEILFSTGSDGIWALERNGVFSDYFPYTYNNIAYQGGNTANVLIGENLNGEKSIFFTCSPEGYCGKLVHGINNRAEELPGFPLALNSNAVLSRLFPANDGSTALAAAVDSTVYAWNTDVESVFWGSACGDKRNSSLVDTFFHDPEIIPGGLMPENMVYNWPNPNNPGENITHIRYYLNHEADINIRIYDLAGDLVDELNDTGFAQIPNETDWILDDISTGVYFARVEARGNGMLSHKFIKIAVIK